MSGKAKPAIDRFSRLYIPEPNSGCWLWLGYLNPDTGYGFFRFSTDPSESQESSHRASWLLHCGEVPHEMHVCHRCDVRCCVNPDHLFLGTQSDNMSDAAQKGRLRHKAGRSYAGIQGERHPAAKLTETDVIEIRGSDRPGREIARRFGVAPMTVRRIRLGLTWQRVGGAT